MSAKPGILVVGATGQQGGAVVSALLGGPTPPPVRILALTRNPASPSAQRLAAQHPDDVELVQGDLASPTPLLGDEGSLAKGSVSAVFLVTVPTHGRGPGEDELAIPFIDAAVAHGVRHIVFSSVDRGGEPKSWDTPVDEVSHFRQKHAVELHLRDLARAKDTFAYTILRPVAFMDNMNPGTFASLMASMWSQALAPTTRLQLVAVRDIGRAAARALVDPQRYRNRAVGLAGDALTLDEARAAFARAMEEAGGATKEMPQAWGIFGKGMLWAISEVGNMFAWFERVGYGVDIEALRKEDPGMLDFETWVKTESKWKEQRKS